jgi:hypothetical protein
MRKCCSLLHCVVVFANEYPLAIVSHFSRVCRQPFKSETIPRFVPRGEKKECAVGIMRELYARIWN